MKRIAALAFLLALLSPSLASAWWNADWSQRKKISLNTGAAGVELKESLAQVPVAVRLHTGNFSFIDAKADGSDLRFVSSDDKTPLKHHVELFDGANELAIVWVQLPKLTPGSAAEYVWLYYGNEKAPAADDAKGTYDGQQVAVFHLGEKEGAPRDATANALAPVRAGTAFDAGGQLGGAAAFSGAGLAFEPAPALALSAAGGFTFSAWLKPDGAQAKALLYEQQDGRKAALSFGVEGERLVARVQGVEIAGGALKPGAWQHVALTVGGGKASIHLDGREAASAAAALPDVQAAVAIGEGYRGLMDEVQLSRAARSADWVKAAALGQGSEGRLLNVAADNEEGASGGHSYFGILIDNLTVDAWVVIVILMVMLAISFAVMAGKAVFLRKTERANATFLDRFQNFSGDLACFDTAAAALDGGGLGHSSLYRLYDVGARELKHRFEIYRSRGLPANLTPQALDAIRASLDAGMVREGHRLNAQMVLLTIAISGGPFLGLLGTVVGVMITFAAIAAAGDVNVNAIAPGIAAALMATVAGLAVAIPSLFGYNYLGSRIKNVSADMHIFADEFITKLAEQYSN
jgi:biopolymer transport protein ExbB